MSLLPYQRRVVDERDDLSKKVDRLEEYFKTLSFSTCEPAERRRLQWQHIHMQHYLEILNERIYAFQ